MERKNAKCSQCLSFPMSNQHAITIRIDSDETANLRRRQMMSDSCFWYPHL